jgi:hypothetical protein
MALPVAQLGYMPNINLPNSINKSTRKDPKIWEQALAAFLSGAAGGAGQQLVGNALSRDFTDQAVKEGIVGPEVEKPTFWEKVGSGPAVNRQQLTEGQSRVQQNTQFDRREKLMIDQFSQEFGLNREKVAADIAARKEAMKLDADKFDFQKPLALNADRRDTLLADSRVSNDAARNAREELEAPVNRRVGTAQADLLEKGGPKLSAETRNIEASAAAHEADAARTRLGNSRVEQLLQGGPAQEAQGPSLWQRWFGGAEDAPADVEKLMARKAAIEQAASVQASGPQPVSADGAPVQRPQIEPEWTGGASIMPRPPEEQLTREQSRLRANNAVGDSMRAAGYGVKNFLSPSSWQSGQEAGVDAVTAYRPEQSPAYLQQLQDRYAAQADKNSPTALALMQLIEGLSQ